MLPHPMVLLQLLFLSPLHRARRSLLLNSPIPYFEPVLLVTRCGVPGFYVACVECVEPLYIQYLSFVVCFRHSQKICRPSASCRVRAKRVVAPSPFFMISGLIIMDMPTQRSRAGLSRSSRASNLPKQQNYAGMCLSCL